MTNNANVKPEQEARWVVPPHSSLDRASLGINSTVHARDLSPEFVKNLSAVVRNVHGAGDPAIGGILPVSDSCPGLASFRFKDHKSLG